MIDCNISPFSRFTLHIETNEYIPQMNIYHREYVLFLREFIIFIF